MRDPLSDEEAEYQSKAETVREARERLGDLDSLAETEFSMLFHRARTGGRMVSGVSAQVRVRDETLEVSEPVETQRGEHLRGTDAWDGMVSLPAKSFMRSSTAIAEVRRQLRDLAQSYSRQAERARESERASEMRGSR